MTTGALERIVRQARTRPDGARRERCELCSLPVAQAHRHMLDVEGGTLLCVCRACSVLFNRGEAGQGRYRLIPERRLRVDGVSPADLGVPVGLAYFVVRPDGTVDAHYPSPAGATRWEIDPQAWREVVRRRPQVAGIEADVEAVLVNTSRGRGEAWLVPVDDCYRLVGVVRRHWRGLYGGDTVWAEIDAFFEDLRRHDGPDPSR
jgi:hypothetical protein